MRLYFSSWVTSQEFDDPRDAEDAVYEMNGRDFLGERLHAQHHSVCHTHTHSCKGVSHASCLLMQYSMPLNSFICGITVHVHTQKKLVCACSDAKRTMFVGGTKLDRILTIARPCKGVSTPDVHPVDAYWNAHWNMSILVFKLGGHVTDQRAKNTAYFEALLALVLFLLIGYIR